MERETKTIKTPGGFKVELKSYITGREQQEIEKALYRTMKVKGSNVNKGYEMDTGDLTVQKNIGISNVVVSVDGQKDRLVDRILDLRSSDYNFVLKKVDEVIEGINDEKKTK